MRSQFSPSRRSFLAGLAGAGIALPFALKPEKTLAATTVLTPSGGDDWPQIQAAIDSLPTWANGWQSVGGGEIILYRGLYRLSRSLDLGGKPVTLRGAGLNATCLAMLNGANATAFKATSTVTGASLRDFKVMGNSANQDVGWLLDTTNMNILTVENVSFFDGKEGCVRAPGVSEWCTFRNVGAAFSPYGFSINAQWYQFYDSAATDNSVEAWSLYNAVDISLINCASDQATGVETRAEGFMIYNSSRISAFHCRAFGDPVNPKLTRGFRIYHDAPGVPMRSVRLRDCEVHNVDPDGYAYEIDNAVGCTTRSIHLDKCIHTGKGAVGLRTGLAEPLILSTVDGCDFSDASIPFEDAFLAPGGLEVRDSG